MTLFTTLLVLIAERLFKLGEHWQLDHRLEVLFRRVKHFSLPATLLMTAAGHGGGLSYPSACCTGCCLTSLFWSSGSCSACCVLARAGYGCTIMRI